MTLRKSVTLVFVLAAGMLFCARHVAAQGEGPREVWAAQPIPETPYTPPNRLIWRLSEIVASHKGQQSWRQAVVNTRDFDAEFIQMAPGEKTKTHFYADDRVFWVVESGQIRFSMGGQEPFVASKGFLVQAAPAMDYRSPRLLRQSPICARAQMAG